MENQIKAPIRIRAFRAVDNPDACKKYIDGHSRILSSVGVEQVTSSTNDWMFNPASYVIICESEEDGKVFGGARVHALGGSQDLPLIGATEEMEPNIRKHVDQYAPQGTGELCGLWNSIEVAGMGIGAIYLIRCSIAILPQLGLKTLWALCSPYTTRIANRYSFLKYDQVGNKGTFYYPKIDLLATIVLLEDSDKLEFANKDEKEAIMSLRQEWNQFRMEQNRQYKIPVNYQLKIDTVDRSVFRFGSDS
ncbi:hypothetical protein KFE98_08510 [bacterium SCSIO 12741]|nr:hypothetical protein KFE98_08510 [bacterium SCSIO 12741]